jgi:ectoine hydroxylase
MRLTPAELERFRADGFVIKPSVFSAAEVAALLAASEDGVVAANERPTFDAAGGKSRFSIWYDINQDVWGAASIDPRIVDPLEQLMGEDMAFYHGKIIFKEPQQGAAAAASGSSWEWHQDYGYWYYSFVFPRLASAWVALDPSTKANGCLQVLRGSNRLGRLDHVKLGDQMGIDKGRFAEVRQHHEQVDCEVPPGSVIYFDSLLVHGSRPNTTAGFRRSFIMCYCAQSNPEIIAGKPQHRRPRCPRSDEGAILARAKAISAAR